MSETRQSTQNSTQDQTLTPLILSQSPPIDGANGRVAKMETKMTTIEHASYSASRDRPDAIGFAKSAIRLAFRALKLRSQRAALHEMPDYLLKDIGIGRSEIDHVTLVRFNGVQSDRLNANDADPR
ncbi:DUF1127 domain-containing protein [Mesorhizobium sp.]|uniref:DUF1127 domain-containing protein n=1 Tax=Mesorhizobium sp. TaxID=1871066 RepID=UPI0012138B52|nr:DUF1127 domain-containing protein [Mesorhizobium sp.]TIS53421.1 MAG: DUF1127 domain-containing protein [Mesorhizobium sp.]TIS85762.1 MAG: DUF1127 domain-containing protein [Mesorhizobium sp.]